MKFAKLMSSAEEMLPDLKHLCIRYKQLKKKLKRFKKEYPDDSTDDQNQGRQALLQEIEEGFFNMLHEDVKQLNEYFCDKEEELVIWLHQLNEQVQAATSLRDTQLCHIGYINLHGQLVLLFHWSMLNYAALVKILKKHDKLLGSQTKAPVLANALKQPFSTTGMLSSLLAACEVKAREISDTTGGIDNLVRDCPEYLELFLVKETQAALDLWSELRGNAITPSTLLDPKLTSTFFGRKRSRDAEARMTAEAGASEAAAGPNRTAAEQSMPVDGAGPSVEGVADRPAGAAAVRADGASAGAQATTAGEDVPSWEDATPGGDGNKKCGGPVAEGIEVHCEMLPPIAGV